MPEIPFTKEQRRTLVVINNHRNGAVLLALPKVKPFLSFQLRKCVRSSNVSGKTSMTIYSPKGTV